MRRQIGLSKDRGDLFARDVGERIELQPRAILLNDRDGGARSALETLAAVEPGRERLKRAFQRLDLTNAAAGIGIGEPQFTFRIVARQRRLARLDGADV